MTIFGASAHRKVIKTYFWRSNPAWKSPWQVWYRQPTHHVCFLVAYASLCRGLYRPSEIFRKFLSFGIWKVQAAGPENDTPMSIECFTVRGWDLRLRPFHCSTKVYWQAFKNSLWMWESCLPILERNFLRWNILLKKKKRSVISVSFPHLCSIFFRRRSFASFQSLPHTTFLNDVQDQSKVEFGALGRSQRNGRKCVSPQPYWPLPRRELWPMCEWRSQQGCKMQDSCNYVWEKTYR